MRPHKTPPPGCNQIHPPLLVVTIMPHTDIRPEPASDCTPHNPHVFNVMPHTRHQPPSHSCMCSTAHPHNPPSFIVMPHTQQPPSAYGCAQLPTHSTHPRSSSCRRRAPAARTCAAGRRAAWGGPPLRWTKARKHSFDEQIGNSRSSSRVGMQLGTVHHCGKRSKTTPFVKSRPETEKPDYIQASPISCSMRAAQRHRFKKKPSRQT